MVKAKIIKSILSSYFALFTKTSLIFYLHFSSKLKELLAPEEIKAYTDLKQAEKYLKTRTHTLLAKQQFKEALSVGILQLNCENLELGEAQNMY